MSSDPTPVPPTDWRPPASSATVGVARRDVTPPLGIRTANWGAPGRFERAEGVHMPLTVTAIAITSAGQPPCYLVSTDLGWWREATDEASVREPVLAALSATPERLLIHLVHTHAGPSLSRSGVAEPGGDLVPAYLDSVVATIIDACREAADSARPAEITWGTGSCRLAVVRDLPYGERDVTAFNPDLAADDTIVVGRIADPDGETLATIVNYACHPTTLAWQNPLLSPDFIGPARSLVEESTGAPCVFLQGASGDLSPRDQYTGDLAVVERNGRIVGHAAMAALEELPAPGRILHFTGVMESGAPLGLWEQVPAAASTDLSARILRIPVPVKPAQTEAQVRARWVGIDEAAARERVGRELALRRDALTGDDPVHHVWLWQVGDAIVVAQPGELFSTFQTELRRRHPDRCVLVLNCTNGPGFRMYLPDRAAYARNRYQVWQTLLDEGAMEAVLAAVDAAIDTLPGRAVAGARPVGAAP